MYNFSLENISTESKTVVRCADIKTIIGILKGLETKEKNNAGEAGKISAKKRRPPSGFNSITSPQR